MSPVDRKKETEYKDKYLILRERDCTNAQSYTG